MSDVFVDSPDNYFIGTTGKDDEPVYIYPRELTTHAAILGMTGSGKTGLGITLLEEAALDGLPQIVIDPKGDMTNLLLAFDSFEAKAYESWINPEDVPQDQSRAEYAGQVANKWQQGLQESGISAERVHAYNEATDKAIYTPGSEAGLPVSVLSSFNAPDEGWHGNEEMLTERIERIASALLNLIGEGTTEVEDSKHILIARIFEYNWKRNNDLTLQRLISQIQSPPFDKLGVMDVDTVLSENDRMKLGKKLNNIIAAPHFQNWLKGRALDIGSMLYTSEGTPRTVIFYTAHLDEDEKQFIHTLIFERILAWVQSLSGSDSLRALVYVDEVFGMLPPHPRNPPTKAPLLSLLKQARAFGVGIVVATQNPSDIDYKALSNAGMWFLGKLQTDNDQRRALEGVSDNNEQIDKGDLADLLGDLEPREFVLHSIHHDETPLVVDVRWAMSYLRGPLTRQQISTVMDDKRQQEQQYRDTRAKNTMGVGPSSDMRMGRQIEERQRSQGPEPAAEVDLAGFSPVKPDIPSNTNDYFLPVEYTPTAALREWNVHTNVDLSLMEDQVELMYRPVLMAQTSVRFKFRKSDSNELLWYAFLVPELPKMAFVQWGDHQAAPFDPDTLETRPPRQGVEYADIPSTLLSRSAFSDMKSGLKEWIYNNLRLTVFSNPEMNFYSKLDESYESFYERLVAKAREEREQEIEAIAERFDRKFERYESRLQDKLSRQDAEQEELDARQTEQVASIGEGVMRLLRGNLYRTVSHIAEVNRQRVQSSEWVEVLDEDIAELQEDVEELSRELERKVQQAKDKWAEIIRENEEISVSPNKGDITLAFFGIGWVPFWAIPTDDGIFTVPATPSGLAEQQLDIFGAEVKEAQAG